MIGGGMSHRGMFRRGGNVCTGMSYGTYLGTKSIYNDGVNNFLRNAAFSYDNSVTGFTILSMWYLDTSTFVDFGYLTSIKNLGGEIVGRLGTDEVYGNVPSGDFTTTSIADTTAPFYIAISYMPDGLGGSTY